MKSKQGVWWAASDVYKGQQLFHPEGSEEAAAFVRKRLLGILEGQVGYVIDGL